MTQTYLRRSRKVAALAVLSALLILGGLAEAAPEEDESSPPLEQPERPSLGARPIPASSATADEASVAQAPTPLFEPMGPDTFPGRLRGLYGGSLWLEPSFHGLQWPQNSRTGIAVSGQFWIDGGYEMIKRDQPLLLNSSIYLQQGRGVLRVTPAYVHDNFFIQGQAELVANLCQARAPNSQTSGVCAVSGTFDADDLWIRVGQRNLWDLTVGRFEGWEVYHLGMGLDSHTLERLGAGMFGQSSDTNTGPKLEAPFLYAVNYMHDRPAEGLAVGHAALHIYVTEYLRFELLGKWGSDNYKDDNSTPGKPYNYLGGRPTAVFDVGWFKFKIGAEYQKGTAVMQTIGAAQPGDPMAKKDPVESLVRKGIGASLQFVLDPIVEFGLNAAIGSQHYTDPSGGEFETADALAMSYTTKSVGGFANLRLMDGWLAGVGANWTEQLDSFKAVDSSANDYTSHLQAFAALQYLLARQLYVKAVFSFARAGFQPSDLPAPSWDNTMYSGRIRLMYLY